MFASYVPLIPMKVAHAVRQVVGKYLPQPSNTFRIGGPSELRAGLVSMKQCLLYDIRRVKFVRYLSIQSHAC